MELRKVSLAKISEQLQKERGRIYVHTSSLCYNIGCCLCFLKEIHKTETNTAEIRRTEIHSGRRAMGAGHSFQDDTGSQCLQGQDGKGSGNRRPFLSCDDRN